MAIPVKKYRSDLKVVISIQYLLMKPARGGIPAKDSKTIAIVRARIKLCLDKPDIIELKFDDPGNILTIRVKALNDITIYIIL